MITSVFATLILKILGFYAGTPDFSVRSNYPRLSSRGLYRSYIKSPGIKITLRRGLVPFHFN